MSARLLLIAVLASGALDAGAAERTINYRGTAMDEQGNVVYLESHREVYDGDGLRSNDTRYLDAAGKEFASLDSQFTSYPYLPEYRFEDQRFGRRAGTRISGDQVETYGQTSAQEPLKKAAIKVEPNMVTGQGLHFYLRDHVEELVGNEEETIVQFLVPMEGDHYPFRIRRLPSVKPGTVALRVEAGSWFLRLFAPDFDITYERDSRRLLRYEGPSNLLSDERKPQNVVITYSYEGDES